MDLIMKTIAIAVMLVAGLVVYYTLMKLVFPAYILKLRFSAEESLGRGLRKFKSKEGRAVLYEPHPAIRKYIRKYAVFSNHGMKYLKCDVDSGVSTLNFSIITFNNKNRIIDVICVDETICENKSAHTIALHDETSYVALVLNSVNGESVENEALYHYRFTDVCVYAVSVTVLTFFTFILTAWAGERVFKTFFNFKLGIINSPTSFVIPALIIGVACATLSVLFARKKGVRTVFK